MSKRLSPKVGRSLTEFCEQSLVDSVCDMVCIISLHKKQGFSRKYYNYYLNFFLFCLEMYIFWYKIINKKISGD